MLPYFSYYLVLFFLMRPIYIFLLFLLFTYVSAISMALPLSKCTPWINIVKIFEKTTKLFEKEADRRVA